jgi:hypothetical protein
MSKFLKMAACAALVSGFGATTAFAGNSTVGTISSISGDVLIERNGQYLAASNESGILAGDVVFATSGASATLIKDNCAIDLTANSTVAIGEAGDCSTVLLAQAAPSTEFATPSFASLEAAPAASVIIAALVVGGGFIYGISEILDDNDDEFPTSP